MQAPAPAVRALGRVLCWDVWLALSKTLVGFAAILPPKDLVRPVRHRALGCQKGGGRAGFPLSPVLWLAFPPVSGRGRTRRTTTPPGLPPPRPAPPSFPVGETWERMAKGGDADSGTPGSCRSSGRCWALQQLQNDSLQACNEALGRCAYRK